jgi:hypothetical protein
MPVPFTFGTATAAIPLSQLDTNFATAITLGNTAMYLGNTTTSVGNLTLTNVTISSGTANVTANITYGTANAVVYSNASNVGTTSANLTFDGTTLTIANNPTLTAGTANGVTYLNGSKVLTSGSALTFDGTVLTTASLTTTADASSIVTLGRFSSGYTWSLIRPSSTATGIEFRTNAGDTLYQIDQSSGANKHIWYTGGTERMRLDSSGNLGLGVTPSAWGTAWRSLDMFGWGSVASASDNMNVLNNAYITASGSVYKNTGFASRYAQSGGVHYWFNAPSGTAGNAITFTQAMTLDASGNLGIGTTSPGARLDVVANDARINLTSTGSGQTVGISIKGGAGGGDTFNFIESLNSGGTQAWYLGSNGTANTLAFKTNGNNERMRIDSSGNVGVGTTTPDALLQVYATAGKVATFGNNVNNNGNYVVLGGTVSTKNWVLANNMIVGGEFGIGRTSANGGTTIGSAYDLMIDTSGNLIQSAPTTPPSLATNGQMVFNLTSNTNLRVSVRGSDGVTRTANITLA